MKKLTLFFAAIILFTSCSTTYNFESDYSYNRYFQQHEPYHRVDNEYEAAKLIARKLGRIFRRMGPRSLAVLDFSDEYGDRSLRGRVLADMIVMDLYHYRNPVIIKRGSLNELMLERELSTYDLLTERGYRLRQLANADFILHGRIQTGVWDEVISLRCFEAGSGKVMYAATIRIDRRHDLHRIFDGYRRPSRSHPRHPRPPRFPDSGREDDDDEDDDDLKKKPSNNDGIEKVGKKELDKSKPSDSEQYKKKESKTEKNEDEKSIKKESKSDKKEDEKSSKKESKTSKNSRIKKSDNNQTESVKIKTGTHIGDKGKDKNTSTTTGQSTLNIKK
jgi:hypothetical protein